MEKSVKDGLFGFKSNKTQEQTVGGCCILVGQSTYLQTAETFLVLLWRERTEVHAGTVFELRSHDSRSSQSQPSR